MNLYQLFYTFVGIIIVSVAMVLGASYFISTTAQTVIQTDIARAEITRISAAHLIETCLKNDEGLVTEDILKTLDETSVCQVCRNKFPYLCGTEIQARVENMNTGTVWGADFEEKYRMWINIARGDSIDLGRLYVKV